MLSKCAKTLFVASSLAPALAAFALRDWTEGKLDIFFFASIALVILLPTACALLLHFVQRALPASDLSPVEVQSADKEVLAFLITYLMPLLGKETLDIRSKTLLTLFVFGLIGFVVYHGQAFHFNPLLACVGYHFYQIRTESSLPLLLITRTKIRNQRASLQAVELADYLFLEVPHAQATP